MKQNIFAQALDGTIGQKPTAVNDFGAVYFNVATTFMLDIRLRARVQEKCIREGKDMSKVIRRLMEQWVSLNGTTPVDYSPQALMSLSKSDIAQVVGMPKGPKALEYAQFLIEQDKENKDAV